MGYIYVLANCGMPGVAQIGHGATVPLSILGEPQDSDRVSSPSFVVYQEFCSETDVAFSIARSLLGNVGVMRQTDSCLLVQIAIADAVKFVVRAVRAAESKADDLILELRWNSPSHPWHEVMEEADRHFYGLGEYFEDKVQALKLYREAALGGSPEAHRKIGEIYEEGSVVKKDVAKALESFKTGANLGNYYCFADLAQIFIEEEHTGNVLKAFSRFVKNGSDIGWAAYARFPEEYLVQIHSLLFSASCSNRELYLRMIELSATLYPELRRRAEVRVRESEAQGKHSIGKRHRIILEDLTTAETRRG